jgi:RND family efflux transporter MFP subunit
VRAEYCHKHITARFAFRIVAAAGAVMIALAAVDCKTAFTGPSSAPLRVPEVVVANVVQKDVPIYGEWVGTTKGYFDAKILPKVTGYLLKQDYKDGARVHAGQLLFEIDDRLYKAALDQAQGNLAQLQEQLKQNEQDLARYTALAKAKVISKQQFDTQTQTTRAAAAQVRAAQAAVDNARLNLQWTKVDSPIEGVAGIAQAQVGELVTTTTTLTTVSQLDPIKVSFPISENEYLKFAGLINAREKGIPGKDDVQLQLILSNGSIYSYPGQFYAADRQMNVQTGTIEIQAIFPNPEDILRPGMYAKVRVQTDIRRNALLVPQSAVFEIQGHYQVATVGEDNRIAIRSIKPGKKFGAYWMIDAGIEPKERVVTAGVEKVKQGMQVKPVVAHEPPLPATSRVPQAALGRPAQS